MIMLLRSAIVLLLFFTASAMAAPLEGNNNAAFIDPSASELRLKPYAANVLVEKFGRCRYLTNTSTQSVFVPLGSQRDYESFIQHGTQVSTLRLCRDERRIDWDYADAALPVGQRLSSDFTRKNVGFEQWTELEADRSHFAVNYSYSRDIDADVNDAKSLSVTYTRHDCRTNRNANGSLRSDPTVCNSATWVETGRMNIDYTASTESAHVPAAASGTWLEQAASKTSSAVPPVNIPVQRPCGLLSHNTKRWLLTSTGNTRLPTNAECPYGNGSATVSFNREGEYLCFDGIESRTATSEREVNAQLNGTCDPAPGFTTCPAGQAARWGTGNCVPYSAAAIVDVPAAAAVLTPHGSKTGNIVNFTAPNDMSYYGAQMACAYYGYSRVHDYAGYEASNCGGSCYWAGYGWNGGNPLTLTNYNIAWAKVDSRSSGPITEATCGSGDRFLTLRTVAQESSNSGPVAPPSGVSSCAALTASGVDTSYTTLHGTYNNRATTRASTADARLTDTAGTVCKQPYACYEQSQLPGGLVIDPTNTNCAIWILGICYRVQSTWTTTTVSCEPNA